MYNPHPSNKHQSATHQIHWPETDSHWFPLYSMNKIFLLNKSCWYPPVWKTWKVNKLYNVASCPKDRYLLKRTCGHVVTSPVANVYVPRNQKKLNFLLKATDSPVCPTAVSQISAPPDTWSHLMAWKYTNHLSLTVHLTTSIRVLGAIVEKTSLAV